MYGWPSVRVRTTTSTFTVSPGRAEGNDGPSGSDLATALQGEEVDRKGSDQELSRISSMVCLVSRIAGKRRVRGGEEVVVEHPGLVAELLGGHEREVAVAAGLRLRRVVERPHGVPGHAGVVPAVVVVLPAHPVVVVQGRKEADLVAGRAELRRPHERLHERLPVQGRLHPDQELVDLVERLVLRERERILLALLDDVAAVPAQVLDLGDRVAGHAGQPLLRLELVVGERRHRGLAHLAREEDDGVVAARAPLRLLAADAVGHQLDGAPVEGVVERREAVGALLPALVAVGVALLAVLVRGELLPVEQALVERLGRGEEELGVAVRVHDALRRLLQLVEAGHHEEERRDGAAPLGEHPEVQLVDGRAPVEDERDERDRDREDVREVDGAVRERGALEGHVDARADARERERDDRDARDLRVRGSGCSRASAPRA